MEKFYTILYLAAFMAAVYLIRYVVSKVLHTGADAITNKLADRKNEDNSRNSERLSDTYSREKNYPISENESKTE